MRPKYFALSAVAFLGLTTVAAATTSGPTSIQAKSTTEQRLAKLEKKVAALEADNAQLRRIVQVGADGVTITSPQAIELVAGTDVTLRGTQISVKASKDVVIKGKKILQN